MAVKKLTETGIAKITPPASGRLDIADSVTTGLVLRVTSSGVKTWCFVYRFGNQQRRMNAAAKRYKKKLSRAEEKPRPKAKKKPLK